jgi:hypothetical protein
VVFLISKWRYLHRGRKDWLQRNGEIKMLGILEIVLTVRAWKQGWGAKALIPMATGFVVGILMVFAAAATGAGPAGVSRPLMLLGDLIVTGTLFYMVRNPQRQTVPVETRTSLQSEPESEGLGKAR